MRTENPRHTLDGLNLRRLENVEMGTRVIVYPLKGQPFVALVRDHDLTIQIQNPSVLVEATFIDEAYKKRKRKMSLGGGTAVKWIGEEINITDPIKF